MISQVNPLPLLSSLTFVPTPDPALFHPFPCPTYERCFVNGCLHAANLAKEQTGIKVIVLALDDDLAALNLLDKIQDHMRLSSSSPVCVCVSHACACKRLPADRERSR